MLSNLKKYGGLKTEKKISLNRLRIIMMLLHIQNKDSLKEIEFSKFLLVSFKFKNSEKALYKGRCQKYP